MSRIRKMYEVECSWCGSILYRSSFERKRETHFCKGNGCRSNWTAKNRSGVNHHNYSKMEVECSWCGSKFLKKKSQVERTKEHFCPGSDCHHKWLAENAAKGEDHPKYSITNVNCSNCGQLTPKRPCDIKRTENLFCSLKCNGEWKSKNLTGKNSHTFKGGKIEVDCGNPDCDKKVFVFPYKLELYENNFCDIKCRNKWQKYFMTGEGSPVWNGGTSFEKYPVEFSKSYKDIIRERDEFKCQECGAVELEDDNLSCHHIDYNKRSSSFYNVISLCRKCHGYTNFNRKYWTNHFQSLIREKYNKN